jgi:hypothetical protein
MKRRQAVRAARKVIERLMDEKHPDSDPISDLYGYYPEPDPKRDHEIKVRFVFELTRLGLTPEILKQQLVVFSGIEGQHGEWYETAADYDLQAMFDLLDDSEYIEQLTA